MTLFSVAILMVGIVLAPTCTGSSKRVLKPALTPWTLTPPFKYTATPTHLAIVPPTIQPTWPSHQTPKSKR